MSKVLTPLLLDSELESLFQRVVRVFDDKMEELFGELEVNREVSLAATIHSWAESDTKCRVHLTHRASRSATLFSSQEEASLKLFCSDLSLLNKNLNSLPLGSTENTATPQLTYILQSYEKLVVEQ